MQGMCLSMQSVTACMLSYPSARIQSQQIFELHAGAGGSQGSTDLKLKISDMLALEEIPRVRQPQTPSDQNDAQSSEPRRVSEDMHSKDSKVLNNTCNVTAQNAKFSKPRVYRWNRVNCESGIIESFHQEPLCVHARLRPVVGACHT